MANNNQTYTTTVVINDAQAKRQVQAMEKEVQGYRKEMDKAYSSGNKALGDSYAKKIKATNKELNRLKLETMDVNKILNNLSDASLNQLQKAAKSLNSQMKNLSTSSDEFRKKAEQLKQVNTALANARAEYRASSSWTSRLADGFNKWQGAIIGAAGAITGITMTVRKSVDAYASMEEAMADVRKYTGMTDEEVRELNEDLKKMDTRTSREELNALAGDAGRLGIQGKEAILEFVDAADKIHVALGDDLGESAVRDIGKLSQTFGDADNMGLRGAMLATGSAVNELAQSSSAAAGYIVDFTAKIAGSANQAGLAQTQVMGYASVLDQNMQQMEVSSTALSQLLTKMFQDPAKFAHLAGVEVGKFSELLRTDANQALLTFLGSMKAKGGFDSLAPMFAEMGLSGQRCVGVLSTLATNLDEIKTQQEIAAQAFKEGTSVLTEFEVQNNTVQAGLEKAKKAFNEIAVELGYNLYPVAKYTITGFSVLTKVLLAFISVIKNCRVTIIAATAALVLWNAAAIKALVVEKVTTALKATKAAFIALSNALKVNPWVLFVSALATVTAGIIEFISRTKDATKQSDALAESAKRQKETQEQVGKKTSELVSKYRTLQIQWKALSTEQEKNTWIKKNQQAFAELGISINNVNQAENYMVKNAKKVTDALKSIAEAAVWQEKLQQAVQEKAEWEQNTNGRVKFRKADNQLYGNLSDAEKQGLKDAGIERGGGSRLTQQEINYVNSMRLKAARTTYQKSRDMFDKEIDYAAKKLADVSSKIDDIEGMTPPAPSGDTSGGGSGSGTTDNPMKAKEQEIQDTYNKQLLLQKEVLAGELNNVELTAEQKLQAEKDYNADVYALSQERYARLRDLYAKDSVEWNQWEDKRLTEQVAHDKERLQAEAEAIKQKLEERLKLEEEAKKKTDEIKNDALSIAHQDEDELQQLRLHLQQQEMILRQYRDQQLISEEEYQQALDAIREAHGEVSKQQAEEIGDDWRKKTLFALQQVSNIIKGVSSYVSASYEAEKAAVEERYNAEIEAAREAGEDTTEIEKKKKKEIQAIELKQIEAETNAQIAESLINVAMSVTKTLAAYAYPYNVIAAAITSALGMVQVATIQKQAEARKAAISSGYYAGGFTGGKDYHREAGVVHEGEFVANHESVNNPAILPLLNLIDSAQRNNTAGALTREDISRQLGTTQSVPPVVNVQTDNRQLEGTLNKVTDAVSELSRQIEDGIETNISIQELEKKRKTYNKLISA